MNHLCEVSWQDWPGRDQEDEGEDESPEDETLSELVLAAELEVDQATYERLTEELG